MSQKNLYTNVLAALYIVVKKYKQPKYLSTDGAENVIYPYNGAIFGYKKEWSTETHYNMDKPWKHYTKRKRPITQDHKLYHSIHMKCSKQRNLWRQSKLVIA